MVVDERVFTRDGARAVDAAARDQYGIPTIVLMENAAAALERECERAAAGRGAGARCTLVLAGPGNNGGDGFAVARRLHNAGWRVLVALAFDRARASGDGDAAVNLRVIEKMGLPIEALPTGEGEAARVGAALDRLSGAHAGWDVVVDSLLGTGVAPGRTLAAPIRACIEWVNALRARDARMRIVAADVPSGLDCDTGEPVDDDAAVRAHVTVSFVGVKRGFLTAGARRYTGEVVVGDIGAPRELIERFAMRQG